MFNLFLLHHIMFIILTSIFAFIDPNMSNLSKLQFDALNISGENYLKWILDAKLYLSSKGLGDAIKENNETSEQDKAKAMIFLRHHIHDSLKSEYLTVEDPCVLWTNLKERYDHQKDVTLPTAKYEWLNLRLEDFKSVKEYNSVLYNITSRLKLCGEDVTDNDMLEKTYQTFPPANILLMQGYRNHGFTKYSHLLTKMLVAEKNNELLLKSHELRPTGSAPRPETNNTNSNVPQNVNPAVFNTHAPTTGHGVGRGHKRGGHRNGYGNLRGGRGRGGYGRGRGNFGRGRGRGRGVRYNQSNGYNNNQGNDYNNNQGNGYNNNQGNGYNNYRGNGYNNYRGNNNYDHGQNSQGPRNDRNNDERDICRRCGKAGHFAKVCRASQYEVDQYQASLRKGKSRVETNVVKTDDEFNDEIDVFNEFLMNNDA